MRQNAFTGGIILGMVVFWMCVCRLFTDVALHSDGVKLMAVFLHMFHVIALAADVNVISARLYHLSKQSDEPEMWYIWGPHINGTPRSIPRIELS